MKVTISVGGKFHAFHLAKQLQKRGYLEQIFTTYPWYKVKDAGLSREQVRCLIFKEILERSLSKIPYINNKKIEIPYHAANLFDKQVARRIKPCDIFVGWSAFSLYTLRQIRRSFPAKIILEHVSTHTELQRDALIEEQKRLGIKADLLCPSFIKKIIEEFKEADYIIVPSSLSRQTFLDKGFSPEKIICVPFGVDTQAFRPIPKNDRPFRIISVGISIRKGTHYLLQAIDELKIKDLEIWLIGRIDNDIKPFLKKYSGVFKYLGGIPQKELYKYYSQGSVLVLFSLEEGLPYSLLEAMACGLTVICSDKTSAKDVVREGVEGFIIPAKDVRALKEKILYLYENPHIFQEMGKKARENVAKNFTWDNYGEKIINAYINLLK